MKALFFDIDGTLLSEKTGEIPESTRQALEKARNKDCLLFVNTGRTMVSLPQKVRSLNFNGYVCGCGTNLYYEGKKLFSSKVSNERCREVAQRIREMKIPAFYEADDAVYFDATIPNADHWIANAKKAFETEGRDLDELLQSDSLVYDKVLMLLEPSEEGEALKKFLSSDFICIDRGRHMWEVTQKNCSKATGIHFLCRYLNLKPEDCYVFGDSENDRTMLEAVPNSVVMGNGEESVKSCCSYVTDSVEEDGILKAMEHFGLI